MNFKKDFQLLIKSIIGSDDKEEKNQNETLVSISTSSSWASKLLSYLFHIILTENTLITLITRVPTINLMNV